MASVYHHLLHGHEVSALSHSLEYLGQLGVDERIVCNTNTTTCFYLLWSTSEISTMTQLQTILSRDLDTATTKNGLMKASVKT